MEVQEILTASQHACNDEPAIALASGLTLPDLSPLRLPPAYLCLFLLGHPFKPN